MKKFENILYFIMCPAMGLIVLIILEGIVTLGGAFQFKEYGVIGWIFQVLAVITTICIGFCIAISETRDSE